MYTYNGRDKQLTPPHAGSRWVFTTLGTLKLYLIEAWRAHREDEPFP